MGNNAGESCIPPEGLAANATAVHYEYTSGLAGLLARLQLSVVVSSTYQAGQVITVGTHGGELQVGFASFSKAMGICRTPQGLAIVDRDGVWRCPASKGIAPRLTESGSNDCAFLARGYHRTGPVMGHELGWIDNKLWLVVTGFNCLATLEEPWSFVPEWWPEFIPSLSGGDCCHLNGMAASEKGQTPEWVTVLGETKDEGSWRTNKKTGGALIHVPSNSVVKRGLCMPHSPRLYRGKLYLLESGQGALLEISPETGDAATVIQLPGFTRGLDLFEGHAFIGLSKIRESATFGGLPIADNNKPLLSGFSIINLQNGQEVARFWFNNVVDEIFSTVALPGICNPLILGPHDRQSPEAQSWLIPQRSPP
mgnify:CR=1 FL=1